MTTAIAIISIVIQMAAAVAAISLVSMTRPKWVWSLLATGMVTLAAIRVAGLIRGTLDPAAEVVYLVFSVLVLAALLGIRPMCRAFHTSVGRLDLVEAELEAARRRLGYVLDTAPIIVFAVDSNGVFTLSEGRGLKDLGLQPGQLVGQSVFDVYHDYPAIVSNIRRALAGEEVSAPVDVVEQSYEVQYSPLRDGRGRVTGVFGVAADVSRRKRSEAQLRATKDRFRALVETTSDWVWEVDLDGIYTYVSPKVKELLGYDPDELIGKTPFDLMPPDTAQRVREQFRKYVSERDAFSGVVNSNLHKDGHEVVLETSGVPVFGEDGHLIGYRGIDRDITTRMRDVEALSASEDRLKLAIVAADMGTWDWDVATNKMTWSEQVERLFSLETGTFDGTFEKYLSLIHPDDRDHVQFAINAALENKVSPYRALQRVVHPSGDTRYIEAIGQVLRDDNGAPVRMLGLATDVTDRVLADHQLRKEKEMAQMYLDIVGTIMVSIDRNRRVRLINRRGCELLGYDEEEIIGEDWFEHFLPAAIRETTAKAFEQLIAGHIENVEYFENPVLTRSGEERLIAWHNAPMYDDDGEIVGTMSSGADITDRHHAERINQELEDQLRHSQRMETIGTLAGGIAHDFNNILSPILGYTDMAIEDVGEDSPIHHYLENVLQAAQRAKELVEQILLFSKNVDREASPIHLHVIIREGLKFVRASLPTTIEIQQNVNIDSGVVLANSAQIHQILVNLCTNAAHAMRETGGVLRVALEPVDVDERLAEEHNNLRPGPYARLMVQDTGGGMDETTLQRIFEPFFTTKDIGEGTGLGLSVVHGIVINHGGEIVVASESGEGTTVTVYFPHTEKSEETTEEIVDVSGTEHVLFVDDEPAIVTLGRRMLERLGYRVTTASDGEEALEIIREDPNGIDIVLTDQTMPRKTGLDVVTEAREIREGLPVVLMTGYSDKITPEKLDELEVSGLVTKPLSGRNLGAAIRNALD